MRIIMAHGIWDTGDVFRTLVARLEADGHRCAHPTFPPNNGRHGLADLAAKLKAKVETPGTAGGPVAVIGFSMGAVVARHYLQTLGGAARVSHFFNISGPQNGTLTARLWPGKAARDMRPGSEFLRALNRDTSALAALVVHSYHTPFDLMVLPSCSSRLPCGGWHTIPALLHHRMLTHPKLLGHIAGVLPKDLRGERPPPREV